MKKILYIFKELFFMVRKYKIYFLAPIFIILTLLAILCFYLGPTAVITFIYAGI